MGHMAEAGGTGSIPSDGPQQSRHPREPGTVIQTGTNHGHRLVPRPFSHLPHLYPHGVHSTRRERDVTNYPGTLHTTPANTSEQFYSSTGTHLTHRPLPPPGLPPWADFSMVGTRYLGLL